MAQTANLNRSDHQTLLPPPNTTKLRLGYVLTGVCDSVRGGGERGGLCSNMHHRSHDWGEGGLCPGEGVSVRESPRTVMSGRYVSYWNAFLSLISLRPHLLLLQIRPLCLIHIAAYVPFLEEYPHYP